MKWFEIRSPQELTALMIIRYIKGGADAAEALEELTLLTLDEQLEEEAAADVENHPPTTAFNFVLATQPESSSKEDEATPGYFTQDLEDEDEFHPLGKTSEDVVRALEEGKKVKVVFFYKDPYPEDCKYVRMAPPVSRGSSPRFVKISNGPNTNSECSNLLN